MSIESAPSSAKIGAQDRSKTDLIVLHSIGGFACKGTRWTHHPSFKKLSSAVAYFARRDVGVGTHYILDKNGEYAASTPEEKVANHVFGREKETDPFSYNQRSIGIEMLNDGDGKDPFPANQIDALFGLLKELVKKYKLGRSSIKAHSDLDNCKAACEGKEFFRRIDPGPAFPMKDVLNRVFE